MRSPSLLGVMGFSGSHGHCVLKNLMLRFIRPHGSICHGKTATDKVEFRNCLVGFRNWDSATGIPKLGFRN